MTCSRDTDLQIVRNRAITVAALTGTGLRAIAQEHGISHERVSQLVQEYCLRVNPLVYALLAEDHAARVYSPHVGRRPVPLNVLRNNKVSFGV